MEKHTYRLATNIGLLFAGFLTVFSGILIQVKYHMGHHGNHEIENFLLGMNYNNWRVIHKITIVILSFLMIIHTYLHLKWYKGIINKRLFSKNSQVIILTLVFFFVSLTGYIPWIIDMNNGDLVLRKMFIEIHDKLALILTIYLILHLVKRMKWYFITIQKFRNQGFKLPKQKYNRPEK